MSTAIAISVRHTVTAEAISSCLGEAACKYALNKKRGGSNGKKGTRYEDFFLAYKTAEAASQHSFSFDAWPYLEGQTLGFVDDAVLHKKDNAAHYQLKNVKAITWTGGEHPIETDFSYQIALSTSLLQPSPSTSLVVSDKALRDELLGSMPESIKAHSDVEFFPYGDGSFNRLVLEYPFIQDVLRPLSKSLSPTMDELVSVYGVLILGCMLHPEGASVDEIIRSAKRYVPDQLGSIGVVDMKKFVTPEFVHILGAIPGLVYAFDKGFFSWKAFGTSGVFEVDCSTEQFKQFQATVIQQQPATFDEFEGLLP